MKRLLLAISLVTGLAACTQKNATEPATPAEPSTSTVQPAEPGTTETAAAESGAPAAESTAAASNSGPAQPIPAKWKVDVNYKIIAPAQTTNVDAGQVEIIEFLWLGCPHCYELNPYIEAWKKKLPSHVVFRQEHVTWDSQRLPHAKLFYTLRALGAGDDVIVKAFDEIHRKGNYLMAASPAETERMQMTFAVANGLDGAAFQREYNGFAVNTSVKRADDLVRRYRVDSVPVVIVNGKYRTDVSMAGGPAQLTELLTDLAASEKGN
jgi:thiol:disulfide interchange protein DsbA